MESHHWHQALYSTLLFTFLLFCTSCFINPIISSLSLSAHLATFSHLSLIWCLFYNLFHWGSIPTALSCQSIKVIILHKNGVGASVDGREVIDESSLLLRGGGEMVLVLHGWEQDGGKKKEGSCEKLLHTKPHRLRIKTTMIGDSFQSIWTDVICLANYM